MMEILVEKLLDTKFLVMVLTAIATAATVATIALPLLEGDSLKKRMKSVATEREKIRARERERLAQQANRVTLRQQPKVYMKQVVEQFKLGQWLGTGTARTRLAMAGYRGSSAETAFLFFRFVMPIGMFFSTLFYMIVVLQLDQPLAVRLGIAIFALYVGIKLPEVFLANVISKRQQSMKKAFPDALDLLLICVESGMSIEAAFRKVSHEIGSQSVPLAEELTLATAELSYLPERRLAYENLAVRTGVDAIKSVTTAMVQAERYGTPLGNALRVLAQESRDQRMNEAEKKAAALPPKLTVPMILFFLPVLFAVILTPALIQVFNWN
jgi:tight adherence protein C